MAVKGERDYHYGGTPQAVLDVDVICSNLMMASASLREYYVSSVGSDDHAGTENIMKAKAESPPAARALLLCAVQHRR